jgi:hypothetical protein
VTHSYRSRFGLISLFALALGIAPMAQAATVTYNVGALDNATGFGYDPDKTAPTITADGFHASGGVGDYNSVRFTPGAIGLTNLTLGDITSIAYEHRQATGGLDWQLKVYTESSLTTGSGWYGYRLNYDLSTANSDGSWSVFTDTNAGAERIKAFNASDVYNVSNPSSFASLLGTAGSEKVLFFDISAGANSGGFPYNTDLQDITINTKIGDAVITAVTPIPSVAAAAPFLFGLLGLRRRSRR